MTKHKFTQNQLKVLTNRTTRLTLSHIFKNPGTTPLFITKQAKIPANTIYKILKLLLSSKLIFSTKPSKSHHNGLFNSGRNPWHFYTLISKILITMNCKTSVESITVELK